jgi:hypothetical protein
MSLLKKNHLACYKSRFSLEFFKNPQYAYTLYQATQQALALKYDTISVIEFGVAGGSGLRYLEKHAGILTELTGLKFEVYGFDTAEGLPELEGYKDIMHQWRAGSFPMDLELLKSSLKTAKLVIGDVKDTIGDFYETYKPAPVGAILFDVDLYSSTKSALRIFDTAPENFLPRVRCYFDDIIGNETALTNEFMGEKLAIAEYNDLSDNKKITPVYHMLAKSILRKWYPKCYVHHMFDHPRYSDFIANPNQFSPLR